MCSERKGCRTLAYHNNPCINDNYEKQGINDYEKSRTTKHTQKQRNSNKQVSCDIRHDIQNLHYKYS